MVALLWGLEDVALDVAADTGRGLHERCPGMVSALVAIGSGKRLTNRAFSLSPDGREVGLSGRGGPRRAAQTVLRPRPEEQQLDDLKSLVTQARDGDLDAYAAIVRRFQDMAYGFAYSYLGDFHLAQDAAQEAFIEAYRDLRKLCEPAAFPGWFRKIVHKHCDRFARRKRVATVPLDVATEAESRSPEPAEEAQNREMQGKVLAAIRGLPDSQRTVTALYYIDGYSQNEIADFLDVPTATVRKRLERSREQLKERMLTMVDESLKSVPLPDRFADVVVQLNFVTDKVNPLADKMSSLTDDQMLGKTDELRARLARGESRELVRAQAFALVREASRRARNQPHYDIQLVASLILDEGWIAEEATGEGKTVTCYPAAYMAALEGMHVHVVTVNDYLAERDAELAEAVFSRLGVTVGYVSTDKAQREGKEVIRSAYRCDITYGTNCELGFDHLRDTLRPDGEPPLQGPLDFAIIDEADSVLIDEARTPLIISRRGECQPEFYRRADGVARELIRRSHLAETGPGASHLSMAEVADSPFYAVDPKHPAIIRLTAEGRAAARQIAERAGLELGGSAETPNVVEQALRAHLLYQKDREYVVKDGRVLIVDEHTGRLMPGRRWSEGLHQAIECKEGMEIRAESETLASITFRDYFGLYKKLAGLTGTAKAEASYFREAYDLDVVRVPTRRPVNRVDYPDRYFPDTEAKYAAIADEVQRYSQDLGRPVLIGLRTIEECREMSEVLTGRHGIRHEVLDARPQNATREAEIVASAGTQRPAEDDPSRMVGAVTIATHMAGRGTDIKLAPGVICDACRAPDEDALAELGLDHDPRFPSGTTKCCINCPEHDRDSQCAHCFKPKVDGSFPGRGRTSCREEPPCGLHVVGGGRYESRRVDEQFCARAGARGEPGSSRFFLSLDDEVVERALRNIGREETADVPPEGTEDEQLSDAVQQAQSETERENFRRILALG